jgi:hypothetical protein
MYYYLVKLYNVTIQIAGNLSTYLICVCKARRLSHVNILSSLKQNAPFGRADDIRPDVTFTIPKNKQEFWIINPQVEFNGQNLLIDLAFTSQMK